MHTTLAICRVFILTASSLLLLICGKALAQTAPMMGAPLLSPAAIHIGAPTSVLIFITIKQGNVIPSGVNVLRVAPTGLASVIGTLNDSGLNGDVVAGDGVYSGRVTLNEASEGNVRIRVSVAVLGSIRRIQSPSTPLAVVPAGAPIDVAIPNLNQQTTDPVTGEPILANSVNACFTDATSYSTVVAVSTLVGGTPTGRYSEIGNCYQISISPGDGTAIRAAIAVLSAQPEIRFAEPEPIVQGSDVCTGPICVDPNYSTVLNLPQAHNVSQGQNVVIGILDTGLQAALIPGITFPNAVIGSNFINPGSVPTDDNGHGTLVAYIAQSTAPDSTLYITKMLDRNKNGTPSTMYLGMRDALLNGPAKILNMSFSSRIQPFIIRELIAQIFNADPDIVIVAAAGNDGNSIQQYPAAHIGVVAVGNVDDKDNRWMGQGPSNFGPWVNIAAPGVNVAGLGLTGTSFSAPFVSGTVALMKSKFPSMTRTDLRPQLFNTALPIPSVPGQDTCPLQPCNQDLGAGRLDPQAALGSIRITRSTAVNAPAAGIIRTIDVIVTSATTHAILHSSQQAFLGQSPGCEVATVKNPPCISNVPFDFAALPAGQYLLQLSFRDPTASFFGSVQLAAPGTRFSSVILGSGIIHGGDPTRADFSLFGFSIRTVLFEMDKT